MFNLSIEFRAAPNKLPLGDLSVDGPTMAAYLVLAYALPAPTRSPGMGAPCVPIYLLTSGNAPPFVVYPGIGQVRSYLHSVVPDPYDPDRSAQGSGLYQDRAPPAPSFIRRFAGFPLLQGVVRKSLILKSLLEMRNSQSPCDPGHASAERLELAQIVLEVSAVS